MMKDQFLAGPEEDADEDDGGYENEVDDVVGEPVDTNEE